MSFKPKKLTVAVMIAMGVTSLAQAQTATTEKTVITGSNIKRVDQEPVAPVDIITREQIEKTGLPTVAEVLRSIPSNTGGSYGENFSNSFARGAAGISLRGLGQKATLVLINGRRTSGYGFAQNLQDTFVDLNSIPSSAIERIEVLKDGASAIYGSDAIAGVVNIILRRDFRGVEASADYGWFEGKHDQRASITAGMGDLGKDRYNVFGVFDYYKRDLLNYKDSEFGKTRDARGETGGRNEQSLTAGGTWRQLTPAGGLTQNFRAMTECPGTVMNGVQAAQAGLINISNPAVYPGSQSNASYNTNLARAVTSNTFCTVDFNQAGALTALPGTERYGFVGRLTYDITPTIEAYGEIGLSQVKSDAVFTPRFFAGNTALRQTPAGLAPFTFNVNFAPGVAGNPFNTPAQFSGNLFQLGTLNYDTKSDTGRFLAGLKYTFGGWDGDSAVGYSKNKVTDKSINTMLFNPMAAALGVGIAPQPPIPTSTSSSLNLDRPSTTPQSVYDSFLTTSQRKAESKLTFADTRLSSELLPSLLPGGPIGVAVGVETRKEELQDRPDPRGVTGEIFGQGVTATDASRTQYAGFLEFALPFTRQLEGQAAVRYDHYSDFGSATTPKFGLKFKATPWLLLRANWGRGFRAPTLPEISPSIATFFTQVNDPITGQSGVQISGVFAGNPGLQPEKSTSTTIGIVFEPSANFNVGINLYEIDWKNLVTGGSFQVTVNDCASANPPPNCSSVVIRDPATNTIVTVLANYFNQNSTITRGADLDAKYSMGTGFGRFTARLNATYVDTFKEDGVEQAGRNDGLISTIPRVKGQFAIDYDNGPLSMTAEMNYIHHYWQGLLAGSRFIPNDPSFQTRVYPDQVPSYTTYSLYGKYQITKNLAVYGSVVNLTDKLPPYDPGFSSTNLYDFSLYDPRGRMFRLGLTYKM
jgi:iron complex outermembrane receptor protein